MCLRFEICHYRSRQDHGFEPPQCRSQLICQLLLTQRHVACDIGSTVTKQTEREAESHRTYNKEMHLNS